MKYTSLLLTSLVGLTLPVFAGDSGKYVIEDPVYFDNIKRPITNPTLWDTALPETKVRAIFLQQNLAETVDTTLGQLPVDGDMQIYALQVEFALNERFSLVATKDGYINFKPDSTFSKESGFANLAAGVKWAWLYQPENQVASAFQLVYEAPSGNRDVWQGTGDGQIIPTLLYLHNFDQFQYSNAFGFRIPIDGDADSTHFYTSHHVGFHLTDWLYPLVEVNWFRVLDPGDGGSRFADQAGGITPSIARFEAGDLVNWGASNAEDNKDLVTMGVGFRADMPFVPNADFGFAYEFPLTSDSATIMDDRFTIDMVIKF